MQKSKIEWCDMTWNPVTGCLHGCEYCYARGIARRFAGFEPRCGGELIADEQKKYGKNSVWNTTHGETLHIFSEQPKRRTKAGVFQKASFPYNFEPTLHFYRLDEPQKLKKPSNIFVCSMADLFGDWIPDEWIQEVFKACEAASQHRYLFLTKNPYRYLQLSLVDKLPKSPRFWYGTTITQAGKTPFNALDFNHNFISVEPLQEEMSDKFPFTNVQWAIIGAETGNRKGKIVPEREWVEDIVNQCRAANVPVFMKNSLAGIWDDELTQEYPEGLKEG